MDGDALFPHVIGLCGAACFEFFFFSAGIISAGAGCAGKWREGVNVKS